MVAYPILLEGQTRAQLKEEAKRYVLEQGSSSLDARVLPIINEFAGKSTDDALRALGSRYQRAGNLQQKNALITAMGYYHLVRELTKAQAESNDQYEVASWSDLNLAARDRAIELANAATTPTQRAAQLVITDDPTYRNRVAKELDSFLAAQKGKSDAQIRVALQKRIYDNQGTGQYLWEGLTSDVTNWTLSNDMLKVYEAKVTGQAPAQEAGGNLLESPANAATPPAGTVTADQAKVHKAAITAALAEITGTEPGDKGMMNPARTDHDVLADKVRIIVNKNAVILAAPQAERNAFYARLLKTYKTATNAQDRLAAGYALDVFMRAVDHTEAHNDGQALEAFANRDAYLAWSRDNESYARDPAAWRKARGQTSAAATGGAGDGAGTGGSSTGGGSAVRKRPVQKVYKDIDPTVQLALERLDKDTGQPGTDGPNQFDTTGASTPDGKRGTFTNQAIEEFRASKPEYKDLSEEALFAEIIKAGDLAYAAKGQGNGQASDAPAPAANLEQLKATLTQIASGLVDDEGNKPTADASDIRVTNPAAAVFKPEDLKVKVAEDIVAKLKKAGVTDETVLATIAGTVTVDSNYRIHSTLIDTLEELSGFTDHNDTLDGRSAMLLDNSDKGRGKESMAALASAINNGTIKVVASAGAPGGTPSTGVTGGQGAGR